MYFIVEVESVTVANGYDLKKSEKTKVSYKKSFLIHKIDLTKLAGKGDFLCPICETKISPDDETEEVYTILEPKVKDNHLESLLIQCNSCSNKILLHGFSLYESSLEKINYK